MAGYRAPMFHALLSSVLCAAPAERSMAGEDFGAFGSTGDFPSLLLWVGTAKGGSSTASLHSSTFAPEARLTLDTGVRALTIGALELFTGPR